MLYKIINWGTASKSFKYCYSSLITLVICLHTVKWVKSSIWPIDGTSSGTTTPSESEPRSNDYEGVLHIPQSSSIIGATRSDGLASYSGHSLGWWWSSYTSIEIQLAFVWVLWHINHCKLVNPKSSLNIYIKYIWFVNTFCR